MNDDDNLRTINLIISNSKAYIAEGNNDNKCGFDIEKFDRNNLNCDIKIEVNKYDSDDNNKPER